MTRRWAARWRLLLGLGLLSVCARTVTRDGVPPTEARLFRTVNGLPDGLYRAVWTVMQGGALGAAPVAATSALLMGRRRLAGRLLIAGSATWAASKAVKGVVRRARPTGAVETTRVRGRPQTGLGFVSGHAGVAAALVYAVRPELSRRARAVALLAIPTVGLARMYVGAHLPLDVAGGVALGVAVEAATELAERHPLRCTTGPYRRR